MAIEAVIFETQVIRSIMRACKFSVNKCHSITNTGSIDGLSLGTSREVVWDIRLANHDTQLMRYGIRL